MNKFTPEHAAEVEKIIRQKQADTELSEMQGWIDSGTVWQLEGSAGRAAMDFLKAGKCFLPATPYRDYWGNRVPSRDDLQPGTTGTLENAANFYNVN